MNKHLLTDRRQEGGQCVCGMEMLTSNFNEKNRDMIYIQILTI